MTAVADRPTLPRGTADAVVRRLFPQPNPYAQDPVGFCRDVLRFEPWSKQRQILEAVRDHPRTAVRSGHGTGKTAVAAGAALWFLDTFERARVITTALTWGQVERQLWREIHGGYRRSRGLIRGSLFQTKLELEDGSLAVGLSTDRPERFHGEHAENLLLVVDEASGVDEQIFEAATGYLTAEHARLLLLGNPTQLAGTFYRAFHDDAEMWETIRISVIDSPAFTGEHVPPEVLRALPTREWVDGMRALYGEESPVYQVRVLGDFPRTADNTVCSLGDFEQAQRNDLDAAKPCVVSVDVARYGSDETVIGVRRGDRFRVEETYVGKPTTETAGRVAAIARRLYHELHEPVTVVVDDVGVGGGVTDQLRAVFAETLHHAHVAAFNGGEQPYRAEDYPNRRSETWFALADWLPDLDLDPADRKLLADVVAPRYGFDLRGRRVVEPKDVTKKRLGRSPDRGDCLVMAFSVRGDGGWSPGEAKAWAPESLTGDLLERAL